MFSIFILLASMIPISLIISLEMVKVIQAFFINSDEDMKNKEEGRYSKAFNSTLNEELGQIQYIFSDKTGTLTSNKMEFQYCLVGPTLFGEQEPNHQTLEGSTREMVDNLSMKRQPTFIDKKNQVFFSFKDKNMERMIKGDSPGIDIGLKFKNDNGETNHECESLSQLVEEFMLSLSLCHDCVLEKDKNDEDNFYYQGPSPDEITLVDTARHLGYIFKNNSTKGKVVEINRMDQDIEVLNFFEFSSKRKRASIIVRHGGKIKFLMKGADSIIMERLDQSVDQPFLPEYEKKLLEFSVQGLRTLLFAMKVLDEAEYEKILEDMDKIAVMKNAKERRLEYIDQIETRFMAIGMTAVEDKLQEKVPECIANFIESNIKVWMLTGDKLETAENIGYSCSLVQKDFYKFYIRAKNDYETKAKDLAAWLDDRDRNQENNQKICVLIEGSALLDLVKFPEIERKIVVDGLSRCDSVICCRMNPKQKGKIVKMVKEYINKITLGIGDGANDVNMIQEADIGIGLYGKEGLRAVQASDYALVEFQALWKLLFVHGRWSYIR